MIELDLPYPPSTNRIWVRAKKGMRKSDGYTAWLKEAGWTAIAQKQGGISGPYKISIQAKRPDKRKRDIDNIIKPISDLLVSIGTIADDCECEMVTARWVTEGAEVHVRIERAAVAA